MIFVTETEEQCLYIFPDTASAIAYCEALDVEAGIWLFWNDAGEPLEPKFVVPGKRGFFRHTLGEYILEESMAKLHTPLVEALDEIHQVVDGSKELISIEEVRKYLTR